jgi:hypothetical protein
MKTGFIIICISIFISISAGAQQLFQDGSGSSNLFFGGQRFGYIFYNTNDKSATVGFNKGKSPDAMVGGYEISRWRADYIGAFELKVKTKDGIGNVFSQGQIDPGITANLKFGFVWDDFFKKGHWLNLYFQPRISYTQYSFIDTLQLSFELQKEKKVEWGGLFNANLQLNYDQGKTKNYFFIGLQTGVSRKNTYDDLDDGKITTLISQSGANRIETERTGKIGSYLGYTAIPLNFDIGWTPYIFKTNFIGFNLYYRTDFFKKPVTTSNIGGGVYIANPQKPSAITGGLGWQFNDLGNKLKKPESLVERSSIYFYVGYAIGAK